MMKEKLLLATLDDMDLLYEWANDDEVRKSSFSTEKILYEDHVKWFHRVLEREDCKQYIYYVDDIAVGQVRITIEGDKAEIGYSICSQYRGHGYAKRMLQVLKAQLKHDAPELKTLVAKVKPENVASQKVFMGLGYEETYRKYEIEI